MELRRKLERKSSLKRMPDTSRIWSEIVRLNNNFGNKFPFVCDCENKGFYFQNIIPKLVDEDGSVVDIVLPKSKRDALQDLILENQYSSNLWMIKETIKNLKMKLKKGERYRVRTPLCIIKTKDGMFQIGGRGEEEIKLYNIDQIANFNIRIKKPRIYNKDPRNEEIESVIAKFKNVIDFYDCNTICFAAPGTKKDKPIIGIPKYSQFKSSKHYYTTILHEIGHQIRNLENNVNAENGYPEFETYDDKNNELEFRNKYCYEEVIVDAVANLITKDFGYSEDYSYCAFWFADIKIAEGYFSSMVSIDEAKEIWDNHIKDEIIDLYNRFQRIINKNGNYELRTEE